MLDGLREKSERLDGQLRSNSARLEEGSSRLVEMYREWNLELQGKNAQLIRENRTLKEQLEAARAKPAPAAA